MQTALLMASKEGKTEQLAAFSRGLVELGFDLLGSAGTRKFLNDNGVPATNIAVMVGDPILDHRVVSLSQQVHGGLISKPDQQEELDSLSIRRIDLLFVDFYHTNKVVAEHPDIVADYDAINQDIDIGGPAAVCSAIKGGRIVLANPQGFEQLLSWLRCGQPNERLALAMMWAEAAWEVAQYHEQVAKFRSDYATALRLRS